MASRTTRPDTNTKYSSATKTAGATLKPYHPTHSKPTPVIAINMLCGPHRRELYAWLLSWLSWKYPCRGPIITQA